MTASVRLCRIPRFRDLTGRYDALLCDIWGVVHNGVRAFDGAVETLRRFRNQGGVVVLLTNAPRPAASVREQLAGLNVAADAYDAIITSGDVTRSLIDRTRTVKVFHLGPERDRPLFERLDIELTGLDACELILCSGLFDDETESPEDYRDLLTKAAGHGLELICANPDHIVHRGNKLIYCAGALADLYEQLGGVSVNAGKPHQPIYDLALTASAVPGRPPVAKDRVLAIGDNLNTDIAGAARCGLDALFVTGGVHAGDITSSTDGGDTIMVKLTSGAATEHLIGYQPALRW